MATGAVKPRPDGGPELGSVLDGKYRLARELGAGAMGRVVEAEHLLLERPVALKLLSSTPDARSRRRMMQEARAGQQLSSEHVVRVFDVGLVGDRPYIVMELLEGSDLEALLGARGPLDVPDAVDYLLQSCVGMAEAHAAWIIHRDLKPSNLFLTQTAAGAPLVKIVDFGVSKVAESAREGRANGEQTADGALLGSPYYMSPEQLRNPTRVDERTDVWALGVTLFRLLSGAHPFEGESVNEVSAAIFTDLPRDLRALRADVPEELWRTIERALAKRPEERTSSVLGLAAELAPFASESGRLAAERLAALPRSVPPVEARGVGELSGESSVADATLGTTLPALSFDKPPSGSRRRQLVLTLVALSMILGAIGLYLSMRAPPSAAAGLARSTAPPVEVAPPAPTVQAVLSAAPARPASPSATALRARTSAPPASRAPRASAERASRPPPPTLDIDGVPIVE